MPQDHQDVDAQNDTSTFGGENEAIPSHNFHIHISSINAAIPYPIFPNLTSTVSIEHDTSGTSSDFTLSSRAVPISFVLSNFQVGADTISIMDEATRALGNANGDGSLYHST